MLRLIRIPLPSILCLIRIMTNRSLPKHLLSIGGVLPHRRNNTIWRRAILHPRHHGQHYIVLGVPISGDTPRRGVDGGCLVRAGDVPRGVHVRGDVVAVSLSISTYQSASTFQKEEKRREEKGGKSRGLTPCSGSKTDDRNHQRHRRRSPAQRSSPGRSRTCSLRERHNYPRVHDNG